MILLKRSHESGGVFAALVVILFLLTLMGVCGVFYWEKEQVLQKYEAEKVRFQEESSRLKEELRATSNEKDKQAQMVKEIEGQYQVLKDQYAKMETEYKAALDMKKYIEEKFAAYTEATKEGWMKLDTLSNRLDKQLSSFFSQAHAGKQEKKQQKKESEEVSLPQIVVKQEATKETTPVVKEDAPAEAAAPAKTIDAQVMSVNKEHNFVVLNKGLVDGIKVNDIVDVQRDGNSIASIRISEIRDFVSLGIMQSVKAGLEIREGDSVIKK